MKQFRLRQEIIDILEELSDKTGKTQTQIVEEAIEQFYENENKQKVEIELYKKENEQLRMVLKVFQEKEKAVEEIKETYQLLLKEKDERINELQERLQEIREKSKPFWKFW